MVSPAREDLPSKTLSTEHEELQRLWHEFIKEKELAVESNAVATRAQKLRNKSESTTQANKSSSESETTPSHSRKQVPKSKIPTTPLNLHIHVSEETIRTFTKGYKTDRDFAPLIKRTLEEPQDARKYRAYRISNNGLLYFEDTDHNAWLCVPTVERLNLIKEIHDGAHETAHAGWERTLATLRDRHRAVEVLYHSFFLLDYCYIMTKTPAVTHIFSL